MIDTNVLVSGLLSPRGNEALIILALRQGLIQVCLSNDILDEYIEVLQRPKFSFPPGNITAVIEMLRDRGQRVQPTGTLPYLPDPEDAKFLLCAQFAQADYIVTGNKRHFPQDACGKVHIVNAAELLDRITLEI